MNVKAAAIGIAASLATVIVALILLEVARRKGLPDPVARAADFLAPLGSTLLPGVTSPASASADTTAATVNAVA